MPDNRNIPAGAWAPLGHEPGGVDRGHDSTEIASLSKFDTMGTVSSDAVNQSAAPSANTTFVGKKHAKGGEAPAATAKVRPHALERNGFQGSPQVSYEYPNAPEAANTFRNVRLMPSAKGNTAFFARRAEGPSLHSTIWPAGHWNAPNKPAGA